MQKIASQKISKNKAVFSLLMRDEFLRRCKVNPSYSLRSFARQLGIDASLLSKVLRGQRVASVEMIRQLGPAIGIMPLQLEKMISGSKAVGYGRLSDDIFQVISDWFHFAILELIKTEGFNSDVAWIANRLRIHKTEALAALERLERLEFIELKNDRYQLKAKNNTWANNEMTTAARKALQKQLLQKAVAAIDDVPFEERESGSLTVACSKKLMPEIKLKIQKFRRELDEFIESHEDHEEVYQLIVSFYPLTKTQSKSGD